MKKGGAINCYSNKKLLLIASCKVIAFHLLCFIFSTFKKLKKKNGNSYNKVGGGVTIMWGAIVESPIFYIEKNDFDIQPTNILHFGCTNNIFVKYMYKK